jgi:hypothetical protein
VSPPCRPRPVTHNGVGFLCHLQQQSQLESRIGDLKMVWLRRLVLVCSRCCPRDLIFRCSGPRCPRLRPLPRLWLRVHWPGYWIHRLRPASPSRSMRFWSCTLIVKGRSRSDFIGHLTSSMMNFSHVAASVCLLSLMAVSFQGAATSTDSVSSAFVRPDCAPNDAPVLNFYFTTDKIDCGKPRGRLLEILVPRSLLNRVPYSLDLGENIGIAYRCSANGSCERATSGTLHVDSLIEGTSVSGDYELHFRDGSVYHAKFKAQWCHMKINCG